MIDAAFRRALASLHQKKDLAYGGAWKKRGEVLGILANVARKVDRIERIASSSPSTPDESAFDTAVDLLIYSLKYQAFLADADESVAIALFKGSSVTARFSDGTAGVEHLIGQLDLSPMAPDGASLQAAATRVMADFTALERCFRGLDVPTPVRIRLAYVTALVRSAIVLIQVLAAREPDLLSRFLAERGASKDSR